MYQALDARSAAVPCYSYRRLQASWDAGESLALGEVQHCRADTDSGLSPG